MDHAWIEKRNPTTGELTGVRVCRTCGEREDISADPGASAGRRTGSSCHYRH